MKGKLWAAILGSLAAVVAPLAVPAGAAGQTEEARTVAAIVIHQAKEASFDGRTVIAEIGGAEQEMELGEYLTGVLLGEMPASFPLEALKAQAVAARTYTLRTLEAGGSLSDDPAVCQAYRDPATADPAALETLRRAVRETDGEVLTYGGELITATYFSSSGGRTEAAAEVWGGETPYLVSVESPGEEGNLESQAEFSQTELMALLAVEDLTVGETSYTQGGGVKETEIGGKTFSGTELRRILGLKSTVFSMKVEGDRAVFTVVGSGHRVGMSQYGAKARAEAGADYRGILSWYYPGTVLAEAT